MAKKVTVLAALLVALVALASATTYTTTVTTTAVNDEASPEQQQRCLQQLQGRQFRSCQRYISQRRSPYEEEVLEMTTEDPRQQEEHLRECCQQLRNVDEQCQCEAIKYVVREVQQEGGSQQLRELYERVSELPRRCSLKTQRCEFRVVLL
ncbi:hypothetical protein CDL12_01565 [Handroanthus impetiginosus]|uniref:Bifunctional inhibitor/plant lipid transfer protein/seed storage helical domain-containing protein n=1 Tax=Handroanthus impetiginosus TaxID=429701 RepID=A0A2G9I7G0_9LAMI|nr:hypothetical protein CDL12_01565 [Handroanthus impetiginosus]